MTDAGPRRYNLADYVESRRREDGVVVELTDGEIIIPPAMLWPDEAFRALRELRTADAVAAVLGDDADRFLAAGGNWRILSAMVRDEEGAEPGESPASANT